MIGSMDASEVGADPIAMGVTQEAQDSGHDDQDGSRIESASRNSKISSEVRSVLRLAAKNDATLANVSGGA